ncbi:uncharacterized protein HKW66_Vig0142400 [Vigna angularis]|uniref:Uncharacterized protein n=1 Tax=Phaseolus angularis TaxID=3914 RepID=A0A8T0KD52_PHAAN|nr:uncharacterized protein HKW66_Vig0142400 [Vigna angularis]
MDWTVEIGDFPKRALQRPLESTRWASGLAGRVAPARWATGSLGHWFLVAGPLVHFWLGHWCALAGPLIHFWLGHWCALVGPLMHTGSLRYYPILILLQK